MRKLILIMCLVGCSNFDQVEIEEVSISNKKVYFKKFSRGLNYELIAISTNNSKNEPNDQNDLVSSSGRRFYYQVKNDTLLIYDGYFPNEIDLGVPVVITSNMKVSEVMKIESDYLNNPDTDFKLFPESHKEILIKKNQ